MTSPDDVPQGELILYETEDGRARIECRFEGETIWITQAQMAELFQTTPQNITQHLREICAAGELGEASTCKESLQVRAEGGRQVSRQLRIYNLEVILAVGFRVRSHRGTQFRKWANARLSEFLVKGFTMDDERLKNPPGPGHTDYFDELLERIRDIRASERRFYQKVLDIYATSVDYRPDIDLSQQFFATVQNKMHWATHGHTAAEVVHERAARSTPPSRPRRSSSRSLPRVARRRDAEARERGSRQHLSHRLLIRRPDGPPAHPQSPQSAAHPPQSAASRTPLA